ncbi:hypothetical protein AVEN_81504-1 [Araneus ventricosus]|uniref:Uncharacterized protein n=1 Tax=Araneus ventricosus TaxID=182803 RepID=A0A4Y2E0U2_ARAVE|nr:hypothetical protein AVEN_81504-1 [Araneus ventricosus]
MWRCKRFPCLEHGNFTIPRPHFYDYSSCRSEIIGVTTDFRGHTVYRFLMFNLCIMVMIIVTNTTTTRHIPVPRAYVAPDQFGMDNSGQSKAELALTFSSSSTTGTDSKLLSALQMDPSIEKIHSAGADKPGRHTENSSILNSEFNLCLAAHTGGNLDILRIRILSRA